MNPAQAAARIAQAAGLCVLPPADDGTKRPDVLSWIEYQSRRSTVPEVERWYAGGRTGVGVVCGAVSGGLEMLEFEGRAVADGLPERYREIAEAAGLGELLTRVLDGYTERTPSGGYHLLYRVPTPMPNTKLASRPATATELDEKPGDRIRVLIETRGEGGYVITAPSNGRVHPTGRPWQIVAGGFDSIATITDGERDELFRLARLLDQLPEPAPRSPAAITSDGDRPGDRYNAASDVQKRTLEILLAHGWTEVWRRGSEVHLRRPGKDRGVSATLGHIAPGVLRVFTTSTTFEARAYSAFGVYVTLEHEGDWSAAAQALVEEESPTFTTSPRAKTAPDAPTRDEAADRVSAELGPADGLGAATIAKPPRPKGPTTAERPWPDPLAPEALHGPAGDFVRAVGPHSEADPAALLISHLVGVGVLVGTAVQAIAGDADHPPRLFAVVVGDTSKGRKGTSEAPNRRTLQRVDPTLQVAAGLSSGEGLIYRVRDQVERLETVGKGSDRHQELVIVDEGVTDKRLLIVETEFASTLRVLQRDGNSLSPVVRLAWDSGDLSTLTRNNPLRATGAHIGIIGHVTGRELLRYLDRTELASGFVNRFLIVAARRARLLPDGEQVPPELLDPIVERLKEVVAWAATPRILRRDESAGAMWREVYEDLSAGGPGLLGSATNRAEAQVLRLSVLYAILDRSPVITTEHLLAALGVWRYAEQSAAWVFGDAVGDEVADAILEAARAKGELSRTDIRDLFARHVNRARIEQALVILVNAGRLERSDEATGGRPREVYRVPG